MKKSILILAGLSLAGAAMATASLHQVAESPATPAPAPLEQVSPVTNGEIFSQCCDVSNVSGNNLGRVCFSRHENSRCGRWTLRRPDGSQETGTYCISGAGAELYRPGDMYPFGRRIGGTVIDDVKNETFFLSDCRGIGF